MKLATDCIEVRGARTHNLQSLTVSIPLDRFTVITGPSGSGKSSLAFDTLYAEGGRRYLETLPGDKRAFFHQLRRPDVDSIDGLPPVICVSQHTAASRPRSTLATITEIHDHLRLLYARFGTRYCPNCAVPIHRHTLSDIVAATLKQDGRKIMVLAPLVQNQPGDHKEHFRRILQSGFLRARVDGVLMEIRDVPKLDAKKAHTIELVVDRLVVKPTIADRLRESLQSAVQFSGGMVVITDIETGDWKDEVYSTKYACVRCQAVALDLEPRDFSFNNPHGACPRCTGYGQIWEYDPKLIVPDRRWPVERILDRLDDLAPEGLKLDRRAFRAELNIQSETWSDAEFGRVIDALVGILRQWAALLGDESEGDAPFPDLLGFIPCPDCRGARLGRDARAVRFAERALHEVTGMTVDAAADFFHARAAEAASGLRALHRVLAEIAQRARFLQQVGLGYLTLDRPANTLSGGEAQRARLATHLGGGLLGVCYILDEPTMGLHPRDTERLIGALRALQERGNTVIAVEHDEIVIRQADYLIDIGPEAGRKGGRLLAHGSAAEVLANPESVTGRCLTSGRTTPLFAREPLHASREIIVRGARHHNLKNVDVSLPIGRWTCLTGVSGSGKSSLARDIIIHAARRRLGLLAPLPGAHDEIVGLDHFDKVLEVDQKPLGRSPRSNPATFIGLFDEIRKLFALTRLAKIRGYKANRFSFNVKGGRCETCQGQGTIRVELAAMPDLRVECLECHGKRFNAATLEAKYRGYSIADVLDLPIAEARNLFANVPPLQDGLAALKEVGLGYLALGQPANTLSGGEAQRVKLAAELTKKATGRTLYLFDEPTTGLHVVDIARLIGIFRKLVKAGNTVIVIEHHLDVIAASDWVIDLGPEGGMAGGEIVATGTPRQVAMSDCSITGRFLRERAGVLGYQ
jgi:excinuclease ABC subunit A